MFNRQQRGGAVHGARVQKFQTQPHSQHVRHGTFARAGGPINGDDQWIRGGIHAGSAASIAADNMSRAMLSGLIGSPFPKKSSEMELT